MAKFSERYGFEPSAEITVTRDAPDGLRGALVDIAYEAGLTAHSLRSIVCRVLRVQEDPTNWSDLPNVDSEVRGHIDTCEWYEVYNIIEECYGYLLRNSALGLLELRPQHFADELNRYFRKKGIGWQIIDGYVTVRGDESFEDTVTGAAAALEGAGRTTAAGEIHQALQDLSRRPEPDPTGALQHGLAALECVMRDVCGNPKATLGDLLASYKGRIPPPLDQAVEKVWGFASEQGRHLREGRTPGLEEAELAVHVAAAVARYLSRKHGARQPHAAGGAPDAEAFGRSFQPEAH